MLAAVDFYRVSPGLPWLPGGVALLSASPFSVRYAPEELASPARARFLALVDDLEAAIRSGTPEAEALVRAGRRGGYVSLTGFIDVADETNLLKLYQWYVEEGRTDAFPGSRPLVLEDLPFG